MTQLIKGGISFFKTFNRDKPPEVSVENGSLDRLTHFKIPKQPKCRVDINFWKERKPEVITLYQLLLHVANPVEEALARSLQRTGQYRIRQLSDDVAQQSLDAKNAHKFLSSIAGFAKIGGKFLIRISGKWLKLQGKPLDTFVEKWSYYTDAGGSLAQNATQMSQQALQMDVKGIDTHLNLEQVKMQDARERLGQGVQQQRSFSEIIQQIINFISRNAEKVQS